MRVKDGLKRNNCSVAWQLFTGFTVEEENISPRLIRRFLGPVVCKTLFIFNDRRMD